MADPTSIKQRFFVNNIGLSTQNMVPVDGVQQGVVVTLTPLAADPASPAPTAAPIMVPFFDPAAADFFTIGQTIEIAATVPAA